MNLLFFPQAAAELGAIAEAELLSPSTQSDDLRSAPRGLIERHPCMMISE